MDKAIIEFVKQNEFLYNNKEKSKNGYSDPVKRENAFHKLALELQNNLKLNKTGKYVADRWRTLRDTYVKATKKVNNNEDTSPMEKTMLKQLAFLEPFIFHKNQELNETKNDESTEGSQDQQIDIVEEEVVENHQPLSRSKRRRIENIEITQRTSDNNDGNEELLLELSAPESSKKRDEPYITFQEAVQKFNESCNLLAVNQKLQARAKMLINQLKYVPENHRADCLNKLIVIAQAYKD